MEKIKQEQQRRKAAEMARLTVEGLSAEREAEATGSEMTTALLEAVRLPEAKQRSTRSSKGTRAKKSAKVARRPAKSSASSSTRPGSSKEPSPMADAKTKAASSAQSDSTSPSAEPVAKSRKQEGTREIRPSAAKGPKDFLALQTQTTTAPQDPQTTHQQTHQPELAAMTTAVAEDEASSSHNVPEPNQLMPPEAAQLTSDALAAEPKAEPKLAEEEDKQQEQTAEEEQVELIAAAEELPERVEASAVEVAQVSPATHYTTEVTEHPPPQPLKPAFDSATRRPSVAPAPPPSRLQTSEFLATASFVPPADVEGVGGDEQDARDIDDAVGER